MGKKTGGKKKKTGREQFSRRRIFDIIQIGQTGDFYSRTFDILLVAVILVNIAALFMETFEELAFLAPLYRVVEVVCILFFLAEYILRIWTADYLYPKLTRKKAVLKFLFSFDGLVELLTILPFFFLTGFVVFRLLRAVRILHLFRINASYDSFHAILSVLYEKRNQIMSSVFILLLLILASSLCMYSIEHDAQPEVFRNAFSGIWWSAMTIFTVGYGDVYPVTVAGQFFAILINLLSVGVIAIPTGIISAGFVERYTSIQLGQAPGEERNGLVSMTVTKQTPLYGKTVKWVEDTQGLDVCVLIRDGLCAMPTRNTKLKEADVLVCRRLNP